MNDTTATAAILLAWKLGAARIYLLGVDACALAGKRYALEEVPEGAEVTQRFTNYDQDMHVLKRWLTRGKGFDVRNVVNLSPISQVTAWRSEDVDSVLPEIAVEKEAE